MTPFLNISEFNRNVVKVFSGSALASLITLIALPFLTRLYSTEDFGNLQLFLSITATFIAISSLKYELAIVLPKTRDESDHVIVLSILILFLITFIVTATLFIAGKQVLHFFKASSLTPFRYLISCGLLLGGLIQICQFLLVVRKSFEGLAKNKILQTSVVQSSAIAAGFIHPGFIGLFLSQMFGQVSAIIYTFLREPLYIKRAKPSILKKTALRYKKFPIFNTPGVLLNTLALELPVFMLARFFGAETIGYYMLASRLINQPMGLISQSVSQVYLQAASEAYHINKETLFLLYKSTVKKLVFIALPGALLIFIFARPVVTFVLGSQWSEAGIYMQIIIFWKFFEFLNAPISTSLSIINRQEITLFLRGLSLPIRFFFMYLFRDNPRQMLLALSGAASMYYLVMNLIIYAHLKVISKS